MTTCSSRFLAVARWPWRASTVATTILRGKRVRVIVAELFLQPAGGGLGLGPRVGEILIDAQGGDVRPADE